MTYLDLKTRFLNISDRVMGDKGPDAFHMLDEATLSTPAARSNERPVHFRLGDRCLGASLINAMTPFPRGVTIGRASSSTCHSNNTLAESISKAVAKPLTGKRFQEAAAMKDMSTYLLYMAKLGVHNKWRPARAKVPT